MKRFWLGAALLAVILGLGLWFSYRMDRDNRPISQALTQAAQAALEEDWEAALALEGQARSRWKEQWHATAALADHAPMDEIDSLFRELEIYGIQRSEEDFAATCAKLSALTRAMGDAHALSWWNLL